LLTPKAYEVEENREKFVTRNADRSMRCFPTLSTQAAMLPTPESQSSNRSPTAYLAAKKRNKNLGGGGLQVAIAMLPTPQASDNRDRGNMDHPSIQRRIASGKQIGLSVEVNSIKDGTSRGLKLQPNFVEWMMGYPQGWTELKDE
jgi:hypothetical protein